MFRRTIIVVAPECVSGQRLLEAARKLGYRVVVAVVVPPEQDANIRWHLVCTPERPGTCDRLIWLSSYTELVAALADEGEIAAVIPGSEFGVEVAELLADHFGVRGNPPATSAMRRNKGKMKEALAAAGLNPARGGCFNSSSAAVEFALRELSWPVMAKPPDGAAALNVFRCRNADELRQAVARVMETPDGYGKVPHGVVVEEFIPGEEYAVNLFGDEEKLVVSSVWRYEWSSTPFADRIYWNDFQEDPDDPRLAELVEYAKRVYRAVGIKLGPAHAEIKLSPRGPVAMEIGARMMGCANETFVDCGMRVDVPRSTVEVFVSGKSSMPDHPRLHERLGCATLPYVVGGTVRAVKGLDEIRRLPTYLCEEMPIKAGDVIRPSRYLDECASAVWLKADSEAELKRDLALVHEKFQVETV